MEYLNEGLKNTAWTNNDNQTITLVQMLELTKHIKSKQIDTESLKSIVLNCKGNSKEIDIKYPILILINDDKSFKYILDGNHRIQKSIKNNLPTVKAKLIQFSKLPEYVQKILK